MKLIAPLSIAADSMTDLVIYDLSSGALPSGATLTRASTGTYVTAAGQIASAAVDEARWTTVGGTRGLLVEPARENLLFNSGDPSLWANTLGVSLIPNDRGAPDGTVTAARVTEMAANDQHAARGNSLGSPTPGTYAGSVFFAAATHGIVALNLAGISESIAYFDLAVPENHSNRSGVITAGISPLDTAWRRAHVVGEKGASGILLFCANLCAVKNTAAPESLIHNGDLSRAIHLWGGQLEIGAGPSSYIPTTGSSATRAADVLVLDVPDGTYDIDIERLQGTERLTGQVVSGGYTVPTSTDPVLRVLLRLSSAAHVSSVPEDDHPEYNPATSYADGDRVIVTDPGVHRIYESLQGSNQGHYPPDEDDAEPPAWWLTLGATNRWRMFDGGTFTATEQATSLTVALLPGSMVDALALFGLAGAAVTVTLTDPTDGEVYRRTVSITDNSAINDYYDWFFAPIETRSNLALLDLPPYGTATLTLAITGATARCALAVVGKRRPLGLTLFGSSIGIIDYSVKQSDPFGNYTVVERRFGYRPQFDVWVDTPAVGAILRLLAGYRATPVVWVGSDRDEDLVYGYYRDFAIIRQSAVKSDCTIDVEGL